MRNVGGSFSVYKTLKTWKVDINNKYNKRVDSLVPFDNKH